MAPAGDRFFELARDLLLVYAPDGTIRRANAAWQATLGLSPPSLVGRSLLDIVEAADLPVATELLHPPRVNGRTSPLEIQVRNRDGDPRTLEWRAAHDAAEDLFYAAARDVTDVRAADLTLRHSEQRFRALFESHPVAMAVWDPATGEVLAANDAALRQYGYTPDELVGLHVEALVHPDDLPRLRASVAHFSQGVDGEAPFRHLRKDGSTIDVEVTGHDLDYGGRPARLVMAIDVTARRLLEQQLREAQKMEAIGRLAGGIAHDFNNTLTAITGYSQLLLDSLEEGDPRREDVDQVHQAAGRAASLTTQLLAFSRRGMVEPMTLDLNEVIRGIQPMLGQLIGAGIEVALDLRAARPWVVADHGQLQQVLINLALNARDAMPDGGTLRLETDDLDAAAAWAQGLPSGDSVALIVSDDGVGISSELRDRVFEPFFTTKEPGQGTGLGLATVYSTVRAAGGRIRLASQPGRGASFRILLPAAAQRPPEPAPQAVPDAVRGTGRILVVEDEAAVRSFVARVLERAGYTVVAAPDGGEAIGIADGDATGFDLVLTDVVMPGMSGIELVRRLRAGRPGIRALLMSGYTEDSVEQGDGRLELLMKPFSGQALLERVGGVLGASAEAAVAD